MEIVFRADANPLIGIGHIMRCLSIADAIDPAKGDICFVLADQSAYDLVRSRGYHAVILNSRYNVMDEEITRWPKTIHPDLIIVDSYYVTDTYLLWLKNNLLSNGKLTYIDDLSSFPYPVNEIINYNAYASDEEYRLLYSGANKTVPDLILGLRYVPLRAMFAGSNRKIQKEAVKQVLVSTGGADGLHIALRLARKVFEQKGLKYRYHFLIGPMNRDKDELYAMSSERDAFSLIENISDMKSLIDKMDIVVSAAGSTLYEICSCGVPLITYAMADNQIRGAKAFEQMDLAISLGDLRKADDPIGMIMDAIDRLSADYTRRTQIGTRMQELIDGRGANRLVHKILGAS